MSQHLNPSVVAYLSTLTYRADAKRMVCLLPLGSIYWDDEIPEMLRLMKLTQEDQNQVWRLFAIRLKLWDGTRLADGDEQFWTAALQHVPNCPLFQRLTLSADEQHARAKAEEDCAEEFETFLATADRVTIGEDQNGLQEFSATFDLTEDQPATDTQRPWWKRLFSTRDRGH